MKPGARRIAELDGLRAITALSWLAFVALFFARVSAPTDAAAFARSVLGRAAWGGARAVDLWLVAAGFLAHHAWSERPLTGRAWARWMARLVARRWPSLLVVLALTAALPRVPAVATGGAALWNLAGLNDLVPVARQTLAWTWPLALLAKLHALAPVLVRGLGSATGRLVAASLGLAAASAVATALTAAHLGLSVAGASLSPDGDVARWTRAFDALHDAPHLRAGAYLVGVAAGAIARSAWTARLDERPVATALLGLVAAAACACGVSLDEAAWLPAWAHPLALGAAGPLVSLGGAVWIVILRSPHPLGVSLGGALRGSALAHVARLAYPGLLVAPLVALAALTLGVGAYLGWFALATLAGTWLASWALASTTERLARALVARLS